MPRGYITRTLTFLIKMKKLSTTSLFIFWAVVTSILTAGLVFYQNNKSGVGNVAQSTLGQFTGPVTLNMQEIAKHNNSSDCWMLISGKVYNITSFFGSHPGGNGTMSATCGKDATDAYLTKDPYATTTNGGRPHSSNAVSMLASYYLGNLNQTVSAQQANQTNNQGAPVGVRGGNN